MADLALGSDSFGGANRMQVMSHPPGLQQGQPTTCSSRTSQAMTDLALGSGSFGGPNRLQMMSHPPGLQQVSPAGVAT